jgi:membrane complex biogenesis BtpA family protein
VTLPGLVGMVHLAPLPGSPRFSGSFDAVLTRAVAEARTLADAGFPALMVENLGDDPYYPDDVPPITVASMTRAVAAIRNAVSIDVGVNVLRNDALAALAVAAATGASMIRVNVLSGTMFTDQGPITGRAAELARARATLAPDVTILADVFVKHAVPPAGSRLELVAADTWERGGADALVVSGTGTGRPVEIDDLRLVRSTVPDAPLVIGSGADQEHLRELAPHVDSVIVGTALKPGRALEEQVDAALAKGFVDASRRAGMI